VNDTAFNFTLEVFYTGGGDIEQFVIQLQQSGSGTFTTLTTVAPVQSQISPRLWYTVVVDPDVFDGLEDPKFNISIVNTMQRGVTAAASGELGKVSTTTRFVRIITSIIHPYTCILSSYNNIIQLTLTIPPHKSYNIGILPHA
jgi:hypothetical protein